VLQLILRLAACAAATAAIYGVLGILIKDASPVRAPLTMVFAAPVWVISFAKYLLALLPAIGRKAKTDALERWNGRYYAYGNLQLRLFLIDDVIWIPASDVGAILVPRPDARELRFLGAEYAPIPGQKQQGYTEAGLLRLLATRTGTRRATHEMIRFKQWLEKETFPNLRRLPASSMP
jgi:hypothetical protein